MGSRGKHDQPEMGQRKATRSGKNGSKIRNSSRVGREQEAKCIKSTELEAGNNEPVHTFAGISSHSVQIM
jgi:hypothetical protein